LFGHEITASVADVAITQIYVSLGTRCHKWYKSNFILQKI